MIGDERDELIERVRHILAPLPPADPRAVARVLSAIAEDAAASPARPTVWITRVRALLSRPMLSLSGVGAIAVLALTLGYGLRLETRAPAAVPALAAVDSFDALTPMGLRIPRPALQAMTSDVEALAVVAVDFVFEGSGTRVSLGGDFNDWAVDSTPMQRIDSGPLWSVTVPMTPGRHVYAFVVDGERWQSDPNAASAPDADFGKPGSVIMVRPR